MIAALVLALLLAGCQERSTTWVLWSKTSTAYRAERKADFAPDFWEIIDASSTEAGCRRRLADAFTRERERPRQEGETVGVGDHWVSRTYVTGESKSWSTTTLFRCSLPASIRDPQNHETERRREARKESV